MSRYRLIALDMDGTLLNSRKKISEKTAAMVLKAMEEGKEVVLSTGRCLDELREYFEILPGLRYLICCSGAAVYDRKENKTIYSRKIPVAAVEEIFKVSRLEDTMVQILTTQSILQSEDLKKMEKFGIGQYRPMFEKVASTREDLYAWFQSCQEPLEKVNVYHTSWDSRERSRERLKNLDLELINAESGSLECSAGGVTKGEALKGLCKYLDVDLQDTIVVGDADNDIDALKIAGLPIAMGNANERVKALCAATVKDCDQDGCGEAIEKYLL